MSIFHLIHPDKTVKEIAADFAEKTKNTIAFLVRDKEKGEDMPVSAALLKHIIQGGLYDTTIQYRNRTAKDHLDDRDRLRK